MSDTEPKSKDLIVFIRLTDLKESPWQSRFEAITAQKGQLQKTTDIDELAASIDKNGLLQPIIVRPVEGGYELIDGHRRMQAMRKLGRGQILAIVRDVSDREAQIMHVIGNLQRKNLKPVELALTYQKMLDSRIFKDKRELSKAIGKDETYVGDLLSTLQLDSRIIEDLAKNNLIKDLRLLRLIRLYEPVDSKGVSNAQWELYRKVLFSKMSRKELALMLKKPANNPPVKSWKMRQSQKKVTISLETGILDQAKKDKLMKLIAEKMQEISDSL
ncbi:MAG: ParB/RepB/Spo0J family partition protein [Lentimicrobium sp.]|uniref:ParB/RepB/Spo0J family partition protein n=1 Tax=Lentimicrobium sp. TaxID=2034841 RepID=UPI0025F80BAA|nr:ParB/RepB/Spo0J family partition protein [Lentimicrobium sp.]MCO5255506.1 ParB/RepB/Spo0J family partition protein [Lentimicrobium sp.]